MSTPSGYHAPNDNSGRAGRNLSLKSYDLQCVQQVYQLISRDPTQHISIEGLAIETGINRTKLQYGFKMMYGININDFQIQQRLERAKELLLNTEKPVKAIAALTGYCSSSRLSIAFKARYGVTPSQFRRQGGLSSSDHTNGSE